MEEVNKERDARQRLESELDSVDSLDPIVLDCDNVRRANLIIDGKSDEVLPIDIQKESGAQDFMKRPIGMK